MNARMTEPAERPLRLHVIVASTRPGRVGLAFAQWFYAHAVAHGTFEAQLVDLAEVALPFYDEPNPPRTRQYVHEHTKAWSATVEAADAFVIVTPEYNSGFTAPLKNALDFLHDEWQHKPVAFVSYGGISGGTRGVQMIKQVVGALKMVPMVEGVVLPFFHQHLDEQRQVRPTEGMEKSATVTLDELARWAKTLRPLRAPRT